MGKATPASRDRPAPPDGGQNAGPDDDNGIPETFTITLETEQQPADNSKRLSNPYAINFDLNANHIAETGPVESDPLADSVAETGTTQLAPDATDNARTSDRAVDAAARPNPVSVQTGPRIPWFRIVLLLLLLQVLTAIALWTPSRLQAVAASTMELLLSTDIPQARTAPGPGPLVGQLEVTSAPSGIKLFLDGAPHGVTPAELVLTAGTHEVTLVSPIGTVRRKVRVRPGHRTLFSEAIFPGSLVVSSAVEVELRIDGKAVGTSSDHDLALAPGSHQLELRNPDGGAHTMHTVEILPGQVTTLNADVRRGN